MLPSNGPNEISEKIVRASNLPQLKRLFLTDAGLETDLIFNRGIDLPCFASITLMSNSEGREQLRDYFRPYLELAYKRSTGFILESASWRAGPDWAGPLGLTQDELDALIVASVELLHELRAECAHSNVPVVVSACMGPRGDGYDPGRIMSPAEAEGYHRHQATVLASARPDMISALTINNVDEAIGLTRAAARTELPFSLSFTVETDGRLPTGVSLGAAIKAVDAATNGYPAYYMINCAHPTHFSKQLIETEEWTRRLGGIRANASRCSHAELDAMTRLDAGDPADLGERYRSLKERFPQLYVLCGCCGTDFRHVQAIADRCITPARCAD